MPKTVQVRDIDDEVYHALAQRAAEAGVSVPEFLRGEIAKLASRPSIEQWLERTRRRPGQTTQRDTLEALDELRGAWPS